MIRLKPTIVILLIGVITMTLVSCHRSKSAGKIKTQSGYETETLLDNLESPWSIAFLPDGEMIFTERTGHLFGFDGKNKDEIARLDVMQEGESGLLGAAVDPKFNENHRIYLYSTYNGNNGPANQVARYELVNGVLSSPTVLLDEIPASQFHDGGRIKFGPDGYLYVTVGDAAVPGNAQDINSLSGKILRMTTDGAVPSDNPFGNYVYSYGNRNPEGLAWRPGTNMLYSSEHGPTHHDELNIITKGANYGWPRTCEDQDKNTVKPIVCFPDVTLAPSGMDFYEGDLYVGCLRGEQLRKIELSADGRSVVAQTELFGNLGRIRDAVAHEGWLYIATNNTDGRGNPQPGDDRIIRIRKK